MPRIQQRGDFRQRMRQNLKNTIKSLIPSPLLKRLQEEKRRRETAAMVSEPTVPFDPEAFPPGINLFANFRHHTGLGQSARLLGRELLDSGVPCALKNFAVSDAFGTDPTELDKYITESASSDGVPSDGTATEGAPYGINIFHVPMHEFAEAFRKIGKAQWDRHYNIAFWLWELEDFPEEWVPLIRQLDEIWTPAEFVSNSLRKVTDKPVITVPYSVTAPFRAEAGRRFFGLPEDKFLYLVMYDANSMADRKNPRAAVQAYRKAFPPGSPGQEKTGLVLKIGFSEENEKAERELRDLLPGYHLFFLRETYPKEEVNALIRCCDVFVSLHRSEGFALVPAEAMILGTPTVTTGWSANTEFQTEDSACLVKYALKPVGKDLWPYRKENVWADADADDAAGYLSRLFEDREFREKIRENGIRQAEKAFRSGNAERKIKERFEAVTCGGRQVRKKA